MLYGLGRYLVVFGLFWAVLVALLAIVRTPELVTLLFFGLGVFVAGYVMMWAGR